MNPAHSKSQDFKLQKRQKMTHPARNNVKVTIGVCVRNGASLVGEAIDSIMNQDFPHEFMEVIFVDDGSEDSTLSTIQSYLPKLDMPVTLFHHEWKGLGPSRNIIVDNAAGEYIIWVDADMTMDRDFVSKQVKFMEMNLTTGIGKGQYGLCDQGSLVGDLENIEFAATYFGRRVKTNAFSLGTGGSIYRVKAIRQIGGFDQSIKGSGEDVDIEYRLKMSGWLLNATSALFYERRRGTWQALWSEYFWLGKGGLTAIRKKAQFVEPYRLWPPVVLAVEFSRVVLAYKLTRRKIVLMLPIHYIFKRIAWSLGFIRNLFTEPLRHA